MQNVTDFTFRTESSGNMAMASAGEHIANTLQLLFNMIPGTDPWDPVRGLDIKSHAFIAHTEESRDGSYEQSITSQLLDYTDLVPSNVMCVFKDNVFMALMSLRYNGATYTANVSLDTQTNGADTVVTTKRA